MYSRHHLPCLATCCFCGWRRLKYSTHNQLGPLRGCWSHSIFPTFLTLLVPDSWQDIGRIQKISTSHAKSDEGVLSRRGGVWLTHEEYRHNPTICAQRLNGMNSRTRDLGTCMHPLPLLPELTTTLSSDGHCGGSSLRAYMKVPPRLHFAH